MFNKTFFGQQVKALRLHKKLKQEELAIQLNVGKSTISRIENAERAVSLDLLIILADYFDVSIDYLVGRTNDLRRH